MSVKVFAGIAARNPTLFRRTQVALGDPAAWIELDGRQIALVRDLEMDRVRQRSAATLVTCPADNAPDSGLDADRETATAQALTQWLKKNGIGEVTGDRTFPFIFAWHLQQAGISVRYDAELGVLDRRSKQDFEIEALTAAQSTTESVMQMICEMIARASVSADGILQHDGGRLTSERVRSIAGVEFMKRGFSMSHGAIVATAPHVADCHHAGDGPLRTEIPVVVDLFPMDESTRYWGDCTRTVVNGSPSDTVVAMHQAVVRAKAAATQKLKLGTPAGDVHQAAEDVLVESGYPLSRGTITDHPSIQHGTGHGIGLDVHEPILLDTGGGPVLKNEVFTIEPGLYGRNDGGVRVEDMLVVTDGDALNLNRLHEGLDWK
ncbi:M24 family metallopeptidase [Stieleria varia]|uniref:Putative peptidase n=1 Tax=Stieleria varia TaxID=2528005 RepID=A0A5C5ZRA2_9BACT|nr:M24 family metallopeptidase [Stieleria varia]TWT89437.1 putative peptidase [Stieleria varia]